MEGLQLKNKFDLATEIEHCGLQLLASTQNIITLNEGASDAK